MSKVSELLKQERLTASDCIPYANIKHTKTKENYMLAIAKLYDIENAIDNKQIVEQKECKIIPTNNFSSGGERYFECSICPAIGTFEFFEHNFCPCCGSKIIR